MIYLIHEAGTTAPIVRVFSDDEIVETPLSACKNFGDWDFVIFLLISTLDIILS